MKSPLADRLRPTDLEDVVGQQHLIGPGKPLRKIIESGNIPNMIFYGSSGIGKTTIARIIAEKTHKRLHKLNGTSASTADIKAIVGEIDTFMGQDGILLYLDEIQYLNKKQQQSLLEYIENGKITLIASTTENPYFYIYNAILSRSIVFEFKPVAPLDVEKAVRRAFEHLKEESEIVLEESVPKKISLSCGGDVRKALNIAEMCFLTSDISQGKKIINSETLENLNIGGGIRYDRDGDEHYDVLSAFQKSIRGSDENAALHYLARLVSAGDLISICRRLLVIACEDIGLAYPQAITIVKACVDSAVQLGFPEARIPLAEAVILLCTSPKSNSAIMAIDSALADLKELGECNVPSHLQDTHYSGASRLGRGGYLYPHSYPNNYVKQQYLPDSIKDRIYYNFGENKVEQAAKAYRKIQQKK